MLINLLMHFPLTNLLVELQERQFEISGPLQVMQLEWQAMHPFPLL